MDQTAFKYDEVWDDMKEAEKRARKSKEEAEEGRAVSPDLLALSPREKCERKETDVELDSPFPSSLPFAFLLFADLSCLLALLCRQPKYMAQAIASAATRKLDRIRAEEKMLERERELEGDEFADKDKFVTQAYKDQMAEVRRAEEEETATEGQSSRTFLASLRPPSRPLRRTDTPPLPSSAAKLRASSVGGISSFYKSFLEKDAQAHAAAVSATLAQSPSSSDPTNLTITKPKPSQGPSLPPQPTSDAALAAEAKAKGLTVETNDSGEIVDSRDLLTPGLNFMPKKQPPPSAPNASSSASGSKAGMAGLGVSRRVGAAAGAREIMERQERMMASQLAEEEKRLVREAEQREAKRVVGVKEKRNDENAVGSARERFLERKRQKVEEEDRRKKEEMEAAVAGGGA